MPQMVFDDTNIVSGMTPAHTYIAVHDFYAILDDISRDLIPTGTGKIFPVVWDSDFNKDDNSLLKGNIWL